MKRLALFASIISVFTAFSAEPAVKLAFASALPLDGKSAGITLDKCKLHNPERGVTLLIAAQRTGVPGKRMLLYRAGQFYFGLDGDKLCFNTCNNGKWETPVSMQVEIGNSLHAAAFSAERIRVISQGDDFVRLKLYWDGKMVHSVNLNERTVADSSAPLEIGHAPGLDHNWRLCGALKGVLAYNKVLSDDEIRKISESLSGGSKTNALTDADKALLARLPKTGSDATLAAASAICNLAEKGSAFEWRNAAKALIKGKIAADLRQYTLDHAILTVVTVPGCADAVSLYDTLARRELLRADNPWFRIRTQEQTIIPAAPEFRCDFKERSFGFQLVWQSKTLTATANFRCNKTLDYTLEVCPLAKDQSLDSVDFPALEIRPLDGGASLFSPIMSGIVQPDAIAQGVSFESIYPRAFGAMQYGAFYDKRSCLYWSSANPQARVKMMRHTAANGHLTIRHEWFPARKAPFTPGSFARLAVSAGDWYDAAMLYRKQIWEINALWLPEKGLPRTDVSAWFRDNTFWIDLGAGGWVMPDKLKAVKQYLGLPFGVALYRWNALVWDRDYPHHRAQAYFQEALDECHRLGLRVAPYVNGRLWEHLDAREHDYQYTSRGKANCVLNADGTRAGSKFNGRSFSIICPFTAEYERVMRQATFAAVALGADGIYFDQIGAAAHTLCYDPAHGHAIPDDTAWFVHGHRKVFTRMRDELKARYPEIFFTTEDNAETCIRNFDGMEPWRWMYTGQVPAFSAIYSGYTQLCGLNYGWKERDSAIGKAAWQFVCGAQLGLLKAEFLLHPEMHDFRVWIKQLMRFRLAMLDFFNAGIMARPAEFADPIPEKRLRWGDQGTGWVMTPALYTASWLWNGKLAVNVLNCSDKMQKNTVRFTLPGKGKYQLWRFGSHAAPSMLTVSGKAEVALALPPYSFELLLAIPEDEPDTRLLTKVRGLFAEIVKIPAERDPFVPHPAEPMAFRDAETGLLTVQSSAMSCRFFLGSMHPVRFVKTNYQSLAPVQFLDRIKIGGKFYYLKADRWAEQKIIENTPQRCVVECTGTMVTGDREDEAPRNIRACYTYTFVSDSLEIEVTAQLTLGEGKESAELPELLEVRCSDNDGKISFTAEPMTEKENCYTRKGKFQIK